MMKIIPAKSERATQAYQLVVHLQSRFVDRLTQISTQFGESKEFEAVEWLRDNGQHGGGMRKVATDNTIFNRGSVNVSQVQYDDDPSKRLASASAISTIIHPVNPLAPSVHIHISWTELKDGHGYWRVMADLNPSIPNETDKQQFADLLKQAAPEQYAEAEAQGDKYFYIPALERHRGITHFYLENYSTGNFENDLALARTVGEAAIDGYCDILENALNTRQDAVNADYARQKAYHTLYFFQVLTLDRGTTSGLLVHNQNDVGILGSLPSHVQRPLLTSWIDRLQAPQEKLLQALIDCLPNEDSCAVEDETKIALCNAIRQHYQQHPDAINMQASGNTVPTTVSNHK